MGKTTILDYLGILAIEIHKHFIGFRFILGNVDIYFLIYELPVTFSIFFSNGYVVFK